MLNYLSKQEVHLNQAKCTTCGAGLTFKQGDKTCVCAYCQSTNIVENALALGKVEVDVTEDIKKLRSNLTTFVQQNSIDEILRVSQKLLDWIPQDFVALYFFGYAKQQQNQPRFLYDFYKEPPIHTQTELEVVVEHIIHKSELRDKGRLVGFFELHFSTKLNEYLTVHKEREQQENHYANIPRDVFVCFSSYNKDVAERVVEELEADGNTCWISTRNLRPEDADNYWMNIENAIGNSTVFLVISSEESMRSKDVHQEIDFARKYQKKLVEFKIDDVPHNTLFKHAFKGIKWVKGTSNQHQSYAGLIQRIFDEIQISERTKTTEKYLTNIRENKPVFNRLFIAGLIAIFLVATASLVIDQINDQQFVVTNEADNSIVDQMNEAENSDIELLDDPDVIIQEPLETTIEEKIQKLSDTINSRLEENPYYLHPVSDNSSQLGDSVYQTMMNSLELGWSINHDGFFKLNRIGRYEFNYKITDLFGKELLSKQRDVSVYPKFEILNVSFLSNNLLNTLNDALVLPNGSIAIIGTNLMGRNDTFHLVMLNESLEIEWVKNFENDDYLPARIFVVNKVDGHSEDSLIIQFRKNTKNEQFDDIHLVRYSLDGQQLNSRIYRYSALLGQNIRPELVSSAIPIVLRGSMYIQLSHPESMLNLQNPKETLIKLNAQTLNVENIHNIDLESNNNSNNRFTFINRFLLPKSDESLIYDIGTKRNVRITEQFSEIENQFIYKAAYSTNGQIISKTDYVHNAYTEQFENELVYSIHNIFTIKDHVDNYWFYGEFRERTDDMIVVVGDYVELNEDGKLNYFEFANKNRKIVIRRLWGLSEYRPTEIDPDDWFYNYTSEDVLITTYSYYHPELKRIIVGLVHGVPKVESHGIDRKNTGIAIIGLDGTLEEVIINPEMPIGSYLKTFYQTDGKVIHSFLGSLMIENTLLD